MLPPPTAFSLCIAVLHPAMFQKVEKESSIQTTAFLSPSSCLRVPYSNDLRVREAAQSLAQVWCKSGMRGWALCVDLVCLSLPPSRRLPVVPSRASALRRIRLVYLIFYPADGRRSTSINVSSSYLCRFPAVAFPLLTAGNSPNDPGMRSHQTITPAMHRRDELLQTGTEAGSGNKKREMKTKDNISACFDFLQKHPWYQKKREV